VEGTQRRDAHIITFKYRAEKSKIFGVMKRPVAKVYLKTVTDEWLPCFMYIDSGADFTLIPYKFGLMLGLKIEEKMHEVYGVGGGIPVILRLTSMRVNDVAVDARIGWSLREDVPFILGRLDVFNRFHIEFREDEDAVVFKRVQN
jgi:hypothetical protein